MAGSSNGVSILMGFFLSAMVVFGGIAAEHPGRITWVEGLNTHREWVNEHTFGPEIVVQYNHSETITVHPRWYGLVIRTVHSTASAYGAHSSDWTWIYAEGEVFQFNNTRYYLHKVVDGQAIVEQIDYEWSN